MSEATAILAAQAAVLLVGFGYAAYTDLKEREVTDRLWQGLGLVGVALGFLLEASHGVLPTFLWTLLGAFMLQHMFPWDAWVEARSESLPGYLELASYAVVSSVVGLAAWRFGIGPSTVPVSVLAVLVTVLLARGLFEAQILYGGADAKALMVAGTILPVASTTLIPLSSTAAVIANIYPFSVTVLMNAALFTIVIPIAIAVRNLRHHEFQFPRGFLGYMIPVAELPRRFVWVRDPLFGDARAEEASIETSEDDRRRRVAQSEELTRRGVERIWVTPQIPFLVMLAAGVISGLVAGNLLFDLFVAL